MRTAQQVLRFVGAGAVGTALHYLTLVGLVSLLHWTPVLATVCGATLGALCNYYLNRRFSFESSRSHWEALPRFLLMASAGIIINGLIVKAVTFVGFHYLVAQVVATTIVLVFNFSISRRWIFIKTK